MIAQLVRIILTNLPAFLCIAAIVCPIFLRGNQPLARRYLSFVLLLAVGIDGLWAGIFHVFFPSIASAQIGWQQSPFEFEVGIADLALGMTAVLSFRRSLAFQSAVAVYAIIFYGGVTIGHFVQAFRAADYAADNFGLLLVLTIARAIALAVLLWASWRNDGTERLGESFNARA